MNKKQIITLLFFCSCFLNTVQANYTVSGSVKDQDGNIIKKGTVTLIKDADGSEVKKTKLNRKGDFKLKKISSGKYTLNIDAGVKNSSPVSVMDGNVENLDLIINIVKKLEQIRVMDTFEETPDGYEVTGEEGFVAVDRMGNALKLVDRLEFSRLNFGTGAPGK